MKVFSRPERRSFTRLTFRGLRTKIKVARDRRLQGYDQICLASQSAAEKHYNQEQRARKLLHTTWISQTMCWSRLVIIKILLFGQKNEQIFHILSLFDVSYAAHMISTHFVRVKDHGLFILRARDHGLFILRAKDHGLFILRAKDHGLLSYAQRIMDLLSYAQRIMDLLSCAQRYFEVTIFLK